MKLLEHAVLQRRFSASIFEKGCWLRTTYVVVPVCQVWNCVLVLLAAFVHYWKVWNSSCESFFSFLLQLDQLKMREFLCALSLCNRSSGLKALENARLPVIKLDSLVPAWVRGRAWPSMCTSHTVTATINKNKTVPNLVVLLGVPFAGISLIWQYSTNLALSRLNSAVWNLHLS